MKDRPIVAWAGLWRESAEWGSVYSDVMTDCNEAIRPIHDRMPVLLMTDEYDRWLNGSFDDAVRNGSNCRWWLDMRTCHVLGGIIVQ